MGVRVYMLDKLTDEFFISTAATDLSSLVNLTIVVQLKIQAVPVNLASFARYDWGALWLIDGWSIAVYYFNSLGRITGWKLSWMQLLSRFREAVVMIQNHLRLDFLVSKSELHLLSGDMKYSVLWH